MIFERISSVDFIDALMYIRVAVAVADRFSFHYYFCCRPFVRKLPEFKFWVKSAKSLLVSFSMTFFPVFTCGVLADIVDVFYHVVHDDDEAAVETHD